MQGKVAFEEHMAIEETIEATKDFSGESGRWDAHVREILDLGSERLEHMDKSGIEYAILSLNAPGVQAVLDTNAAIALARKSNDKMAEAVSAHPRRYGAFAALPMQDPEAAAAKLVVPVASSSEILM